MPWRSRSAPVTADPLTSVVPLAPAPRRWRPPTLAATPHCACPHLIGCKVTTPSAEQSTTQCSGSMPEPRSTMLCGAHRRRKARWWALTPHAATVAVPRNKARLRRIARLRPNQGLPLLQVVQQHAHFQEILVEIDQVRHVAVARESPQRCRRLGERARERGHAHTMQDHAHLCTRRALPSSRNCIARFSRSLCV